MSRLTAEMWVSAYLARLRLENIPAFVVRKGEATAGQVLIKLNRLDGSAILFQRIVDILTDTRKWDVLFDGTEDEVDVSVDRQSGFDPDLWVIEVEDKAGRHLLDEPGLSD